ncbi:MAG TPA: DsbA family protein, partial [Ideonella sp.]|nr:DsbA family protein [Ideonella sp.]
LTDAAIARGLFGVPTFEMNGRLYWGLDALPMLREDLLANA